MKHNGKKLRILVTSMLSLFILIASGVSTFAYSASSENLNNTREKLTVAIKAEPPTLDPHNHTTLVGFQTQRLIYDTLVSQDKNGEIIPKLASSWEVLDDLTVRFYLRDDVYFHNGDKLTAEDVRYSIHRATVSSGSKTLFSAFDGEKTTVVDDNTIDVCLKYPFAPIFNYLASSRGDIVCKKVVEEVGDDNYGREPVGTGPFMFSDWVSGDHLTLRKNPNYWGDEPAFNTYVARFITEAANRTIELETGNVDIIFDVNPSDIARLKENPNINVLQGPGYKLTYITMSFSASEFENIKIRQAIAHALDMESIVRVVYGGGATVGDSVMSPKVFGYKKMGPYKYDPEYAKQLLAEAGYPNGLDLVVHTFEDSSFLSVLEVAQNMWRQVGINVTISSYDQATFQQMTKDGKVMFGITSTTPSTGDPDHALIVWPSSYAGALNTDDPRIDELINLGKSTYDPTDRSKVYNEFQEYVWSLYRLIPVAFSDAVYAMDKSIVNFDCHPGNTPNLATIVFNTP